jgi:type II secretory pathway component PulJ
MLIVRQRGMGLVELMIASALGVFLLLGITSMYIGTITTNADLLMTERLEQELHAAMDLMHRDLHRAGSDGRPSRVYSGQSNPFALGSTSAYPGEDSNSCITFSYDLDQDGNLDTSGNDERFGFRLKSDAVEMRRNGQACSGADWEAITDTGMTRVTALQFEVEQVPASNMTVRRVRITLTGTPIGNTGISRSVVREIRIRNDSYTPS